RAARRRGGGARMTAAQSVHRRRRGCGDAGDVHVVRGDRPAPEDREAVARVPAGTRAQRGDLFAPGGGGGSAGPAHGGRGVLRGERAGDAAGGGRGPGGRTRVDRVRGGHRQTPVPQHHRRSHEPRVLRAGGGGQREKVNTNGLSWG